MDSQNGSSWHRVLSFLKEMMITIKIKENVAWIRIWNGNRLTEICKG